MSYFQKHKYFLLTFFVLVLVAGISGYLTFTTHDTSRLWTGSLPEAGQNTIQKHNDVDTKKNVAQNFNFDNNEANQNNSNTQTYKHLNTTTTKQLDIVNNDITVTSTKDGVEKTITYHLSPITFTIGSEEYITEFSTGTTVYELMQNLSASSIQPFSFSGKDYGAGMGYFVTEINGIKNNPQAGKYWIYYVNDKSAQVGISNYIINKGDKIKWKYENSF
ncbi:MAG: DUF4430 domain-containing protein [Candidatus Magasanikbacteria bacterium]